MHLRGMMLAALFVLQTGCASAHAQDPSGVTIDKPPPQIETRRFDPQHPPSDMPKLQPGEAAITDTQLTCAAEMAVVVLEPQDPNAHPRGPCHARVKIESVHVKLGCTITIWLPTNASEKIVAHENGHRRISEFFYKDADAAARKIAAAYINQERTADAPDCEAATKKAITDALNEVNGKYMDAVYTPSQRVQRAYDDITDHGRNRVDEDDAIERAMKR